MAESDGELQELAEQNRSLIRAKKNAEQARIRVVCNTDLFEALVDAAKSLGPVAENALAELLSPPTYHLLPDETISVFVIRTVKIKVTPRRLFGITIRQGKSCTEVESKRFKLPQDQAELMLSGSKEPDFYTRLSLPSLKTTCGLVVHIFGLQFYDGGSKTVEIGPWVTTAYTITQEFE